MGHEHWSRARSRAGWFLILAGAIAVAPADGAEPTVSPEAEAYAQYVQSCVMPYHEKLAGWQATDLDGEGFRQAVLAARAAAAASCSVLVERIEKGTDSGFDEGWVLQEARDLLARTPRGRCLEARVIAWIDRNPESLYQLALCGSPGDDEQTALLREAVEIDPGHLGALSILTLFPSDSQVRAEYGASLYERAENIDDKFDAAEAIIEGAIDRGDLATVLEIRERVRRDLIDDLPLIRCVEPLESLGLMEVCLETIEEIAADAASAGEILPDKIVSLMDPLFGTMSAWINMPSYIRSEAKVAELLATPRVRAQLAAHYADKPEIRHIFDDEAELAEWMRGDTDMIELLDRDARLADWLGWEPWGQRKAAQVGRLKAVLEGYPEPLKSSQHYQLLANRAITWRERIGLLRRAVEVDPDSVRARCELAGVLGRVGDLAGARHGYHELLQDDDGSCHAQERLEALNKRTPLEVVPLDDPADPVLYIN